jgi:hypothetical protein
LSEDVFINEKNGKKFRKLGSETTTIMKSKTFQLFEKYALGLNTAIFIMASSRKTIIKI